MYPSNTFDESEVDVSLSTSANSILHLRWRIDDMPHLFLLSRGKIKISRGKIKISRDTWKLDLILRVSRDSAKRFSVSIGSRPFLFFRELSKLDTWSPKGANCRKILV